ncbi:hypothetical protein ACFLKB_02190 [Clostridium sp. FAM 1755]|uniref:hypothetical protein n=1 Tax=Clostridium TaxID=1485 RepID=UPI00325AD5F2
MKRIIKKEYIWNFSFKTLEITKLYLKTAEIVCEDLCGIYEIKNQNGKIPHKIFKNEKELMKYLKKSK